MSKWGVPAYIVGNVLRQLEIQVNELLSLYDGGFAVRFESEKETRDGARDSLEIMVFDGSTWDNFEVFSGGEKFRVASAMRLGLAQLLAHRSGARVETLLIDEPEGLDLSGRQYLVKILDRLTADFKLILLLSHYDDLKEALPSQVKVSRGDDGLSCVEVVA
jgi:exonuclease SbcC